MRLDHQSPPRRKTLESNGWVYYLLHKFSTAVYWIIISCTQFEIISPVVFSGSGNWHISMGSSAHSSRVWSEMSARTVATSETRGPHLLLRGLGSSLDWDPRFSAGQLPGPQMLRPLYPPPQFARSPLWPTGCSSPQIPPARPWRSGCSFVVHPTLPNQGSDPPAMLTSSFQTLFCP